VFGRVTTIRKVTTMSERKTEYTETGQFGPGGHPFATSGTLKSKITPTPQLQAREKLDINGKEFVSVKGQKLRYYDVPTGKGGTTVRVVIRNPQWLFVRESGAHEVIDVDNVVHYIKESWVHLAWENEAGEPLSRF
jgi:hypothetical protein